MNRIYTEIAHRYDTKAEEVERELKNAIMQARKNSSPTAKAFWGEIDENEEVKDIINHIVSRIALVV